VLDDGELKCWWGWAVPAGATKGATGDNLPAVDLGTARHAVKVAGGDPICVVLDDGSMKCWGDNNFGQLGQGTTSLVTVVSPTNQPIIDLGTGERALDVTTGGDHVCVLLQRGAVKCWGANFNGMLGLGDTNQRGGAPGEMGDALPIVNLGTGRTAKQIAGGFVHTCALLDDGSVKCWGRNLTGVLGQGDTRPRGGSPSDMGDQLPAIDLGKGRTAKAITSGSDTACALLDDGTVKCWGDNSGGVLGQGDTNNRGDNPGEMGDALPAIDLRF
jgi:alpha-tubulin suppressor-like RCC1 family protein